VDIERCEEMPDGGSLWLQWERAFESSGVPMMFPSDVETLESDDNSTITFVKMIARRNDVKLS
jgi:hypothetical protein